MNGGGCGSSLTGLYGAIPCEQGKLQRKFMKAGIVKPMATWK
jgi:hypothetical protein